jgi:hypothetical protein
MVYIKNHPLPPQFPLGHGLPVAGKPFVPRSFRPDVREPLRLLLVAQEFPLVVRIAEVLHLKALILVE